METATPFGWLRAAISLGSSIQPPFCITFLDRSRDSNTLPERRNDAVIEINRKRNGGAPGLVVRGIRRSKRRGLPRLLLLLLLLLLWLRPLTLMIPRWLPVLRLSRLTCYLPKYLQRCRWLRSGC